MAIKRDKPQSGTAGILAGLKVKKDVTDEMNETNISTGEVIDKSVDETIDENFEFKAEQNPKDNVTADAMSNITEDIKKDEENSVANSKILERYNNVKEIAEQVKELIEEDEKPVRSTFTIEAITHTQLNELKVYVLPAVTGQKKWGYNDIVNIAIKEYYERQMQLLQSKLKK